MTFDQLTFVKGHGTGNDFVLLPDPDSALTVTPPLVRALCDRHTGIGADGLVRVARAGARTFVMDYWNADGTIAEMCGNAARVFARYLVEARWITPGRVEFTVGGREHWAELGTVGDVAVGLGRVNLGETSAATIAGRRVEGLAVDVGNPHLACLVEDDPANYDLADAPQLDADAFPDGANIEILRTIEDAHIQMRVYERGVGETRSCGTGTVAAAVVHLHSEGKHKGRVVVDTPGGRLRVGISAHPHGPQATLIGPATLVATGIVHRDALDAG